MQYTLNFDILWLQALPVFLGRQNLRIIEEEQHDLTVTTLPTNSTEAEAISWHPFHLLEDSFSEGVRCNRRIRLIGIKRNSVRGIRRTTAQCDYLIQGMIENLDMGVFSEACFARYIDLDTLFRKGQRGGSAVHKVDTWRSLIAMEGHGFYFAMYFASENARLIP